MFIASLLVFIGLAFLLKNVGLIPSLGWGVIWPLLVIWFGVYIAVLIHRASEGWRSVGKFFKKLKK